MRYAFPLAAAMLAAFSAVAASPAAAASRIVIPQALQQSAVLCLAEALKLCPNALSAKDYGVSCILPKRKLLSEKCRTVYDQGVRLLGGQDLHFDLRPKAKPGLKPAPNAPKPPAV